MKFSDPLPIDAALPALALALAERTAAVLVAPPGAGKTTRVPLALLEAPWRGDGRIIVLEPRRLAARGAAGRMAQSLGEPVGQRVGLRSRLETRIGPRTRIEVLTEGVFSRMIIDDPTLDGVAAILFDEFHERSLDADTGLALALDAQAGLRPDLRLLVMSATLEGARVAALLAEDSAPVIESLGRSFPIETRYLGRDVALRIEDQMTSAILRALDDETGSILAFLPGQGEILRVADRLQERARHHDLDIVPLFGTMDPHAQDRAVSPAPKGRRKVVLATSIAETSLTIEGIRVVIDCGLARVPRYDPAVGVTHLETVRVSRAAADQRRGRAGRLEPGVCYRLWDEAQTQSLLPFARPEILDADLSGFLLDLAEWGVSDPATLRWLDPPPQPALAEARGLLGALGGIDANGRITATGRALRTMPLPPRLATMVLLAAQSSQQDDAAEIAALLTERNLGGNSTDLVTRLDRFRRERGARAETLRNQAHRWGKASRAAQTGGLAITAPRPTGALLALAYPDRIARSRGGGSGQFLLANGRAAALDPADPLASEEFLIVANMTGSATQARIVAAVAMETADVESAFADRIEAREELRFDRSAAALRARRVRRLGALTLKSDPLGVPASEEAAAILAIGIVGLGLDRLPWTKAIRQWRDRVMFLRLAAPDVGWPDLSDGALGAEAGDWLAPHLIGLTSLAQVQPDHLSAALRDILPWNLARRLEQDAPTHFTAPTGNAHAIDYESEGAPVLAIRVQELYGLTAHPAIAQGRLPLTLHLLSPAHRPIQITRDLPGFWTGSWLAVRAEMRGRYPRHAWPDDPARAEPTTRAKPRA